MKSSIFTFVIFGLLLTYVYCESETKVSEYEIKSGLLSGGRSYEIKSVANAPSNFTIQNELFSVGRKLYLSENGNERYIVKHDLLNLMSTWTVSDAQSGRELGTIENKFKFIGSKIEARGEFGHYTIRGRFRNYEYKIMKDNKQVAKIYKKNKHLRDTYDLTIYGDADQSLMVLFTIIVDQIREH